MDDLLKVVVVTRGRTGSSAITQELGQAPGCRSEQEAFSLTPPAELFDFPAFETWRGNQAGDEVALGHAYLAALETDARERGCDALFWKLLSNHCVERPYIGDLLRQRGYRAIHLRRQPMRQVVSGLVAQQSGIYVTTDRRALRRRYHVDVEKLRQLTAVERFETNRDEAWLYKHRLGAVDAAYEDYLADRSAFFARIYRGLGLPEALPDPTRFAVTIPDLQAAIANYDEIRSVAEELGESL